MDQESRKADQKFVEHRPGRRKIVEQVEHQSQQACGTAAHRLQGVYEEGTVCTGLSLGQDEVRDRLNPDKLANPQQNVKGGVKDRKQTQNPLLVESDLVEARPFRRGGQKQ
jgi:hypothetical protein